MKYSVKANPSRKVDDSDEIVGGTLRVTKHVNLTINIKEANHDDFITMRNTIIWALNFLYKAPLVVYGEMENANKAIDFLKEMSELWDEAEKKCYDHMFTKENINKGLIDADFPPRD